MITKTVLYFFVVGILTGLVVPAARAWARDLKLAMTWWKWLLVTLWYVLLNMFVFLDFTFIGEGEIGAGFKLLAFQAVILFILAVGLVRLLLKDRVKIPVE